MKESSEKKSPLWGWLALGFVVLFLSAAVLLLRPGKAAVTQVEPIYPTVSDALFINRADQKELEALPGIGPALAERIIAYREAHGGFASLDELTLVRGIGDRTLEGIKAYLADQDTTQEKGNSENHEDH